jgi:hypothetical protein
MRYKTYLTLALAVAMAAGSWSADIQTIVRVFQLRYSSVQDASEAVQPLLSEHGSLTVQPHKSRITVQDTPEVVARVAEVVAELDTSPGTYLIAVELLQGTDDELEESLRAEVDPRLKRMFPFSAYRAIGSTVFEGEVGSPTSADLGEGYRVSFVASEPTVSERSPWGMRDIGNRLHLDNLILERITGGVEGEQVKVEVLRTSVFLSPGQEAHIGAGASEESSDGLVLTLRSRPAGDR